MSKTALITGVGPGTGTALVRRFAEGGYDVAMIARDSERLAALAEEVPGSRAYPCNVIETDRLLETLDAIRSDMGAPSVVVHNAVGGAFGDFLKVDPKVLERNFRINTLALLHIAQHTVPHMIEAGGGALLATGNTSAYRGKANFSAFAPTKAAQRILLESMARSAGPQGVHCAYVAIDAVIDLEWTRERYADAPDDFFCKPADIAAEVYHIAHQPRSAWTFDALIRPHGETW